MRIARVLVNSALRPTIALERDGALYDVTQLESVFGTQKVSASIADAGDFYTRVIALSCAGLAELDDRLLSGDRPTEARLYPNTFLWLPPCASERAMYIQFAHPKTPEAPPPQPSFWIGSARNLSGHESKIPFFDDENEPGFDFCLGALLGEDLKRATSRESERAIIGHAVIAVWAGRSYERKLAAQGLSSLQAHDFASQAGPVLVTSDEAGDTGALRAQVRINGRAAHASLAQSSPFSIAESIAFASNHIDLQAGDIIGAPPIFSGNLITQNDGAGYDSTVELSIERLGKLRGTPVRGPATSAWKKV